MQDVFQDGVLAVEMKPEGILLENAHTDLVFAICLSRWCPRCCNETTRNFIGKCTYRSRVYNMSFKDGVLPVPMKPLGFLLENPHTDLVFAICLSRWCPLSCNETIRYCIGKCTCRSRVCNGFQDSVLTVFMKPLRSYVKARV